MQVTDLSKNEYGDFHITYISKVGKQELNTELLKNKEKVVSFFNAIPEEKFPFKYAHNKWTIKEVLQHITDTERIFVTRALRIARNDKTALPGYDQDEFNPYSGANERTKNELIEDYIASRNNTISLFNTFSDQMLKRIGTISGYNVSTRAVGFIIIGHETHHLDVIKEHYL